ncbi:unnamed protein product [Rotaria sp. Silwood1]|nr:unnamed protein product [Rotaria sp. Silwood1]
MSNDEQRLQLLQTLRYKLSYYNLNWLDIKNIINLFSKKDYIRFDILKFLLTYINNLTNKISIDDFIYLSNQCTNNNEQIKFYLFELLYKKLNIDNNNDIQRIINLFQTINIRQKIETNIQSNLIIKNKFEGNH